MNTSNLKIKHTHTFALFWALIIATCAARAQSIVPDISKVGAPAYVVMDADTGRVLASRNMHEKRFPASTTKTMTALVAVENGDLGARVTVSANPPKIGEQSIYLQQGETFLLQELVEAAMIKSANDSCVAIAEGVAGTEARFIEMMNKKAREVGAKNTHFMNPHGLHHPNHYTTAYDLALITRAAIKHPILNEIMATQQASIRGNAKLGARRMLHNKNRLLYRWNECDGVKTGYTRQAGRCLISSATRVDPATNRPWRLIAVVLRSPDTWTDSHHLLEYGFQNYTPQVMARGGQAVARLDVQGGANQVNAVATKELRLPLRAGEQEALSTQIRSLEPEAPVEKEQEVAKMVWLLHGKPIASVPLVAREAIGKSLPAKISPAAAQIVPSQPLARYTIYTCAILGVLCLWAGWSARARERKREYERIQRRGARRLTG